MSVEFSIGEFLRSGALGLLHLGISEVKATMLLGKPTDVSVKGLPRILKYANVQLTFSNDKLSTISISFRKNSLFWHPSFILSGAIPPRTTKFDEFVELFGSEIEDFADNLSLTYDSQRVIVFKRSKVEVLFIDDRLDKMYTGAEATETKGIQTKFI